MASRKSASSAQYVSNYFNEGWFCEMIYNFFIICHSLLAAPCQNNSASDEDTEVLEECEFSDFTPFVARFCTCKRNLSETNEVDLMTNGMESLRDNAYMKALGLIERLFDYERDLALVESEIFGIPDRMELVFNYIYTLS